MEIANQVPKEVQEIIKEYIFGIPFKEVIYPDINRGIANIIIKKGFKNSNGEYHSHTSTGYDRKRTTIKYIHRFYKGIFIKQSEKRLSD